MTSSAFSQGAFLIPETSLEEVINDHSPSNYRHPTVYDAVAGRISVTGFIPKRLTFSKNRDTTSSSTSAIPPENVLFRSKNAPTRYAEADIYFANNERQSIKDLPESDLLKALHCYTSDFYSHATTDGGTGDWKSLDETALIALGILAEEAARDNLGTTGDLAFTEGEQTDLPRQQIPVRRSKSKDRPSKKRRVSSIE